LARLREFDTEEVLDQVMDVFWRHGYESTSIRDLMEATGLNKGSLYQAFGDKHSLFMTVLERYLQRNVEGTRQIFANCPPGDAIALWISTMQAESARQGCEKGCLLWNTTSEMVPHDSKVKALIERYLDLMSAEFTDVFRRGQAAGKYRSDVTAESLTSYLMTAMAGAASMKKGDFNGGYSEDYPQLVLSTLQA